jgi:hypothetical protein
MNLKSLSNNASGSKAKLAVMVIAVLAFALSSVVPRKLLTRPELCSSA